MRKTKLNTKVIEKYPLATLTFILGLVGGVLICEENSSHVSVPQEATQEMRVCFSPEQNCENLALKTINSAKKEILVQCYSFTAKPIANALIQAHKRGVNVAILYDASQDTLPYSQIHSLRKAGIKTKIDHVKGLAHNKIIIVDDSTVITGSYNFSKAAATRNAENMLYIQNPSLAQIYKQKWIERESSH